MDIKHPGQLLQQKILSHGWTQKDFAFLVGKKVSEVNELIKGKRNITVQWDILLSALFGDPEKKRILLQMDYDYLQGKKLVDKQRIDDIKMRKEQEGGEKILPVEVEIPEQEEEKNAIETPEESPIINDTISSTDEKDKKKEHEIFRDF